LAKPVCGEADWINQARLSGPRDRPQRAALAPNLTGYVAYYHGSRTHLSLAKDAPTPRRVQDVSEGEVIAFPEVGASRNVG
jgi:hypothetical protein